MNIRKLITICAVSIFVFVGVISFAEATTTPVINNNPISVHSVIKNPFRIDGDIYHVIGYVIENVIIPLAGVAATLAFILAGFQYVLAQGNPGKIQQANKNLINVAIGTAILFGAWVIAQVIQTTLQQIAK